jgi:nucleoid-associated protein YgaU
LQSILNLFINQKKYFVMSLQTKYGELLSMTQAVGMNNTNVAEENGVLKLSGLVATSYQKDQLWNTLKDIQGATPAADVVMDIQVAEQGYYTKHTVQKGESLSLIAKHYAGDPMLYKAIFEANRDQLSNPDQIEVGQVLTIPFLK